MRQQYATTLNRQYLEALGITHVSEDGKEVYKNNELLKQHPHEDGYLRVQLYDPIKRQAIPKELRTNASGQMMIGVHRIVYAWHNGFISNGLVVDHINGDKSDNRLENLQLLTPSQNIWKGRNCHEYELKCQMTKPRSFYEDKLAKYEEAYENAKQESNAKDCHKFRSQISQIRARLRYWDSHADEYTQFEAQKQASETRKKEWKQNVQAKKLLSQYKEIFKSNGDTEMWRLVIQVIKNWESYDKVQKDHVFEVLSKHF